MTIHIGQLRTTIAAHDTLSLQTMAASVLANRPSFRSVRAEIEGEAVEIYTQFDRSCGEELLVVRGAGRRDVFRPADREALIPVAGRAA